MNFLVEQAGKPVHKKLIENGATSQLTNLTERRKFGNGLFNGFYGEKEVRQRILRILRILRIEGRRKKGE